ncbi:hypothetical protein N7504_000049 [Penicillium tannophilum]|nr:hypothetical protein N7504_000049 [Penicillium tannophilum]
MLAPWPSSTFLKKTPNFCIVNFVSQHTNSTVQIGYYNAKTSRCEADDFSPASNDMNGETGFTKHYTTLSYPLSDATGVLYISEKNGPYQFDSSFYQGYQLGCCVGQKNPGKWKTNC